jgi:predicted nucleic acid-binding protein
VVLVDTSVWVEVFRKPAKFSLESVVDCLIAACAIRNSLAVLHRDREFDSLAEVSELDVRSIKR